MILAFVRLVFFGWLCVVIWLTLIIFGCGLILWGYVPGVDFWTIWVTFKLIPFLTTFLTRSTTFITLVQPLVQPNYLPSRVYAGLHRVSCQHDKIQERTVLVQTEESTVDFERQTYPPGKRRWWRLSNMAGNYSVGDNSTDHKKQLKLVSWERSQTCFVNDTGKLVNIWRVLTTTIDINITGILYINSAWVVLRQLFKSIEKPSLKTTRTMNILFCY